MQAYILQTCMGAAAKQHDVSVYTQREICPVSNLLFF